MTVPASVSSDPSPTSLADAPCPGRSSAVTARSPTAAAARTATSSCRRRTRAPAPRARRRCCRGPASSRRSSARPTSTSCGCGPSSSSSAPDAIAARASSTTASMSASTTSARRHHGEHGPDRQVGPGSATIRRSSPPTGDSRVPAILSVSMSTSVVALGDRVALRDEPLDDLARLHRQAPLGHRRPRSDRARSGHRFQSTAVLTAPAIFAASGMYRSSSESANGTGVCGAGHHLDRRPQRRRTPPARRVAAMSVASEQRGLASSTTTRRPVFSTDSRIVSSVQRRHRARVDDLALDAGRRQLGGRVQRHAAPCARSRRS